MTEQNYVTSPTLDTESTLVHNDVHFSGTQTLELTDDEIKSAWRIIQRIRYKYINVFRSKFNALEEGKISQALEDCMKLVDQFEDEIKTELAEKVECLATVNVMPVLEGEPIEIEFLGKLPGSDIYKYGMDHERKGWEVRRATAKGEAYYGQQSG